MQAPVEIDIANLLLVVIGCNCGNAISAAHSWCPDLGVAYGELHGMQPIGQRHYYTLLSTIYQSLATRQLQNPIPRQASAGNIHRANKDNWFSI